jgi:hypothetical protein
MEGQRLQRVSLAWGALEGSKPSVGVGDATVMALLNAQGVPRISEADRRKREHYLAFPVNVDDLLDFPTDRMDAVLFSLRKPAVKGRVESGVLSQQRTVFNLFFNNKQGTDAADLESVSARLGMTVIARNVGAVGENNLVCWNGPNQLPLSPNQLHLARVALAKIPAGLNCDEFCAQFVSELEMCCR